MPNGRLGIFLKDGSVGIEVIELENSIKFRGITAEDEYCYELPLQQACAKTITEQLESIIKGSPKKRVTGRPRITYPENWEEVYNGWKQGKLSCKDIAKSTNISMSTFYRLVTRYEQEIYGHKCPKKRVQKRQKITYPENWEKVYNGWKLNKLSCKDIVKLTGISKSKFYRLVDSYEQELYGRSDSKKRVTRQPKKAYPENWEKVYTGWTENKLSWEDIAKLTGISRSTFYRLMAKYEQEVYGHKCPKKRVAMHQKRAYPENWEKIYTEWKQNKLSCTDIIKLLGVSKSTFYRLVNSYEEEL